MNVRWYSFLDNLAKRYRIEGTDKWGINSGRRRYRVTCLECGQQLHEATTGVRPMCLQHDCEECGVDVSRETLKGGTDDPPIPP